MPLTGADGASMEAVHLGQSPPAGWSASLYLCGPSPSDGSMSEWRSEALAIIRRRWLGPNLLVVFVPDPRPGESAHGLSYEQQVAWEERAMSASDVIAFFVPRELASMPGLVTNVKWGRWYRSGRAVLGAPPEAARNEYLRHFATLERIPSLFSLADTVEVSLQLLAPPAHRTGAERNVPLTIFRTRAFAECRQLIADQRRRLAEASVQWCQAPRDPGGQPSWALLARLVDASGRSEGVLFVSDGRQLSRIPFDID